MQFNIEFNGLEVKNPVVKFVITILVLLIVVLVFAIIIFLILPLLWFFVLSVLILFFGLVAAVPILIKQYRTAIPPKSKP